MGENVDLNYKAVAMIVKALDSLIASYKERLAKGGLDDEEWSELTNDVYYMEALVADLRHDYKNISLKR